MITLVAGSNERNIAMVPVVPTGALVPGLIYYSGLANWETLVSGRQVPAGVPIRLAPGWKNLSNFNIIGHIDLVLGTAPLTAVLNQDKEVVPGDGTAVEFAPVTLSAGTYTFTVSLSSEGYVLDSKTFTLVVAVPVATLTGVVTDSTGIPLSGVKVTIAGVSTYTDASGRYGFTGLTPGSYAVVFEKAGYNTLTL